jgi:hypothetical protein
MKMDRKIIIKLVLNMLNEINTRKRRNTLFRDGFKYFENERIKPLYNIKYFINPTRKPAKHNSRE